MSTQRGAQTDSGADGDVSMDADSQPEAGPSTLKRKRPSTPPPADSKSRKRKHRQEGKGGDKEYGVTRGVDFVDVSCVINFDLPNSSRSYTHRVGRTARAGRTGMALSFVVPEEEWGKNKVVGCVESTKKDEKVFARIEAEQAARGSKIKEYKFDMKQVEAFRYRMEDALRAVTRSAIREARIKELKTEILNSDKLKVRARACDCRDSIHLTLVGPLRGQPVRSRILAPRQTAAPRSCPAAHEAYPKIPTSQNCACPRNRRCCGYRGAGCWLCTLQEGW